MLITALDPGRTTGYAMGYLERQHTLEIEYYEEKWSHLQLYDFLLEYKPDHIICESFQFRQGARDGADLYPCELIGVVELAQQTFLKPGCVVYQTASVQSKKKAYFSDARLKELGLYVRGVGHGRSAVKHLLHWQMFGSGASLGIKEIRMVDQ